MRFKVTIIAYQVTAVVKLMTVTVYVIAAIVDMVTVYLVTAVVEMMTSTDSSSGIHDS